MRVVFPKDRPSPFKGPLTHARLRHDYATWHEEHLEAALQVQGPKLPFENRSRFDTHLIIDEAIGRSSKHPAQVADGPNPNFVVSFDMGFEVGFDAYAKRRTSTVTVVLDPTGEVITVHPGLPRR